MPELVRHAPVDEANLWTVLSDVESWPTILPTVNEVERLGDVAGMAVGARFRVAQPRLRDAEYVVTDVVPGRSFVWRATLPGIVTTASHAIETDQPGSCTLRLGIRWSGPLSFVARLGYSRLTREYIEAEADTMFRVAAGETPSAETP